MRVKDLTGLKFGHLTVVECVGKKKGRLVWRCICDCGNVCEKYGSYLKRPQPTNPENISCGCVAKANNVRRMTKHGKYGDKDSGYGSWLGMYNRCYNSNLHNYSDYGGRGIKVCDRWLGEHGFENFLADMGERPSLDHSIDRIDVNGDYTPENCRWATRKEQMNNRRNTSYVFVNDSKMPLTEFCKLLKLNYSTASERMARGIDIDFIVLNANRYRKTEKPMPIKGHINGNRHFTLDWHTLIEAEEHGYRFNDGKDLLEIPKEIIDELESKNNIRMEDILSGKIDN